MTNNNEQQTMNYSKQTQTNPSLPATPFGGVYPSPADLFKPPVFGVYV
jgi:hypothetical protein